MIHKLPNGEVVISSDGTWRTGSFEDERAARRGQRLSDEAIQRLQDAAKPESITNAMLDNEAGDL